MNLLIQSKNATILPVLIAATLACFALAPTAGALCQHGCDISLGNTFLGDNALLNDTTGYGDTAIGSTALLNNTSGQNSTAIGVQALYSNTIGNDNTGTGAFALYANTTGGGNTATGEGALSTNTSGFNNTAIGVAALNSATTPNENTAAGAGALRFDTTGANNTGIGTNALYNDTTGSGNTAVGHFAGMNRTTGSNNIDIGNVGVPGESNAIRLGTGGTQTATYIAGIATTPLATGDALAVGITPDGQLGVRACSARYKENIEPMDKASEAIHLLQPVTFRYKKELDPAGIPQFGLVAEEVEKVHPDLVARDEQGKPYAVRYEAVNAMLLNEFLKEHRKGEQQDRKIEELEWRTQQQGTTVTELRSQVQALTAAFKEQAAQMQKVSDQVRMSSSEAASHLLASKQ